MWSTSTVPWTNTFPHLRYRVNDYDRDSDSFWEPNNKGIQKEGHDYFGCGYRQLKEYREYRFREGPVEKEDQGDEAEGQGGEQEDLWKKKRPWLKDELELRCQPTWGSKLELVERLKEAIDLKIRRYASHEKIPPPNKRWTTKELLPLLPDKLFWRELHLEDGAEKEPDNASSGIIEAPTVVDQDDDLGSPTKYSFAETFNIPKFNGTKEEYEFDKKGRIRKDADGRPITKSTLREKGCIDPRFKKKQKLSAASQPWEFAEAFLPFNHDADQEQSFSFELMRQWTNLKAMIVKARDSAPYSYGDSTCPDFVPFETIELRQFFGLHVLHGLRPTGLIKDEFGCTPLPNTRDKDFIRNNLIQRRTHKITPEKRYEHFKLFLACQDPRINLPSYELYPNWKVRPLIKWLNYRCPEAWMLGRQIVVDDMTMPFKSQLDKRLDIVLDPQADALCDDGYCYQVYMRSDPAPKEYFDMKISPRHGRVMALFDALKNEHHHVQMESVHNTVLFCKAAYLHKNKVLCHGTAFCHGRTELKKSGIPDCVFQEKAKKHEAEERRGTVKAAVLEGDPECGFLIASSIYHTKPINYLTMATSRIEWIEKTKIAYHSREEVEMKFFGLNQLDTNSPTMFDKEVVDEPRFVDPLDRNLDRVKRWWPTMFRTIGVLLTNAYRLYLSVCRDEGVTPQYKTHYDFREAIGKYWISPKDEACDFKISANNDESDVSALLSLSARSEDDETTCPSTGGEDKTTCPSAGDEDENTRPSAGDEDENTRPSARGEDRTTCPSARGEDENACPSARGEDRTTCPSARGEDENACPSARGEDKTTCQSARGEDENACQSTRGEDENTCQSTRGEDENTCQSTRGEDKTACPSTRGEDKTACPSTSGEDKNTCQSTRGGNESTCPSTSDEDDKSCNSVGITDNSLKDAGRLSCRLDRNLDHLPFRSSANARCALHGWLGLREQGHLMRCGTCNVHLCIDCYGTFHRSADLVSQKRMLKNNFNDERKRQKK